MPRYAIGDLFLDIEVPEPLTAAYSETGALCIEGADLLDTLVEVSVLTAKLENPTARDACVAFQRQRARDASQPVVELAADHVHWQQRNDAKGYVQWHVGIGNRAPLVTLSSRSDDRPPISPTCADLIDSLVRSIRRTHDELAPVTGPTVVRDLAPSQALWLAMQREYLADRADGPVNLAVLDQLWADFLASQPTDNGAISAIINELGVAFGDELAATRHRFEWAVVTDAFGTTIALVAYRDTANVVIDPINFVAKRWDGRVPRFFVETMESLVATVAQVSG